MFFKFNLKPSKIKVRFAGLPGWWDCVCWKSAFENLAFISIQTLAINSDIEKSATASSTKHLLANALCMKILDCMELVGIVVYVHTYWILVDSLVSLLATAVWIMHQVCVVRGVDTSSEAAPIWLVSKIKSHEFRIIHQDLRFTRGAWIEFL